MPTIVQKSAQEPPDLEAEAVILTNSLGRKIFTPKDGTFSLTISAPPLDCSTSCHVEGHVEGQAVVSPVRTRVWSLLWGHAVHCDVLCMWWVAPASLMSPVSWFCLQNPTIAFANIGITSTSTICTNTMELVNTHNNIIAVLITSAKRTINMRVVNSIMGPRDIQVLIPGTLKYYFLYQEALGRCDRWSWDREVILGYYLGLPI